MVGIRRSVRPVTRGRPPGVAERPEATGGGVRNRLVAFWLWSLFRLAAAAPRLLAAARPVVVAAAFSLAPAVRRATAANGRRVGVPAGELPAFGRRVLGAFYDVVVDLGRSAAATRADLLGRVAGVGGAEHYHAARAGGRGAVLVTAHVGSFEVGLAALPEPAGRVHVVFKRDAFPAFERLRASLRRRLGVVEAPVDDGYATWAKLRDALRADGVVAVQGDRALPGQRGLAVAVLGGHLVLPTGPFKLAAAAGSPVVPLFAAREPDGRVRLTIRPAIEVGGDVDAAVRRYAAELAAHLARHADQWLVLHPAFCEDAGPGRATPTVESFAR